MNPIAPSKCDYRALRTWRPAAVAAGIVWALCAVHATAKGGPNSASTISCSSDNGQRQYCRADTSHGVQLIRQTSGFGCRPTTWGYDAHGIWVDRGCQAEFDISGVARSSRAGAGSEPQTIGAGTRISVRNSETIDVQKSAGQEFSGAVYLDVLDESGHIAIPRGSYAKLIVKSTSDEYLVLDLESVEVGGLRYTVVTTPNRTDGVQKGDLVTAGRTGDVVDGSKLGHAIAQAVTGGRAAKIPAESFLTFRLEQSLKMGDVGQ